MLLDADVTIDLYKGQPEAENWFKELESVPDLAGIALLEVVFGSRDKTELARIEKFVARFPVIWPTPEDMEAARQMASLWLSHSLGLRDALIAATALRLNENVVTLNTKHFQAVKGLKVIKPYSK